MTITTELDSSLIKIDGQPISIKQAVGYLQLFGKLRPFLQEIVTQHVIYQEIQQREDLKIGSGELEQAAIDYRIKKKLIEPEEFQKWLAKEGLNYLTFQNRIVLSLKLKKLKQKIAAPNLEKYFTKHKRSLDRIELSCLIFKEKELAQQCKERILASQTNFDRAVEDFVGNEGTTAIRGQVLRQKLPAELRDLIDKATSGELVGPQAIENSWCLFQVEQFLPALLEEEGVKQEIEERLFAEWLADRVARIEIKFPVDR